MKSEYYIKLDGLRTFAVLGVMISHWIHLDFVKKLGLGFWGVNLFFVLSGFLITEILLKQIYKNESSGGILKKFYIKRTLRIFPIYYLVILFAFLLNLDDSRNLSLYTFTYTLNFYNAFTGNIGLYLSHIWSLCVEEQFYMIWPILLLVTKSQNHKKLIIGAILAALLFRFSFVLLNITNYNIHNYRMMPACMDALAIGALLAYLKLNEKPILISILKEKYIPLFSLAGYFLIVIFWQKEYFLFEVLLRFLVSVCSFYLIGSSLFFMNNSFGRILENEKIQYLGKISYGLYLYHLIISNLLNDWFNGFWNSLRATMPDILIYNSYIISFPLYLILTIIVASLSYSIIEKPFFNLKHRIENKWNQKSLMQSSVVVE